MKLLPIALALSLLAGCNLNNKPTGAIIAPRVKALPLTGMPPTEIRAAFKRDLNTCASALGTLGKSRQFMDGFGTWKADGQSAARSKDAPWIKYLNESAFKDNKDVKYLVANARYFDLDINMHGEPLAASWIKDSGIYCAVTFARMDEAEAAGETEPGWDMRRYFLDKLLAGLRHPGDEMGTGSISHAFFREFVADASRLYTKQHQPDFRAWVQKAITTISAQHNQPMEPGSHSLADQHKELDKRIQFLQSLL